MSRVTPQHTPAHNHGSEEGPGLACRERLIGDCELSRLTAQQERLVAALRLFIHAESGHGWRECAEGTAERMAIDAALAEAGPAK